MPSQLQIWFLFAAYWFLHDSFSLLVVAVWCQTYCFQGLYTLSTVIVDYRGYRVIAQSIIPGKGCLDREMFPLFENQSLEKKNLNHDLFSTFSLSFSTTHTPLPLVSFSPQLSSLKGSKMVANLPTTCGVKETCPASISFLEANMQNLMYLLAV